MTRPARDEASGDDVVPEDRGVIEPLDLHFAVHVEQVPAFRAGGGAVRLGPRR
jgi:hypothetical protein